MACLRGAFGNITAAEENYTPDLILRDLRMSRVSTVNLGAETAPVLTLTGAMRWAFDHARMRSPSPIRQCRRHPSIRIRRPHGATAPPPALSLGDTNGIYRSLHQRHVEKRNLGERFDVINPATEEVLASVASADIADADAALDAAEAAMKDWAARTPRQRSEVLAQGVGADDRKARLISPISSRWKTARPHRR